MVPQILTYKLFYSNDTFIVRCTVLIGGADSKGMIRDLESGVRTFIQFNALHNPL